mgnify:CR=1 FL=1
MKELRAASRGSSHGRRLSHSQAQAQPRSQSHGRDRANSARAPSSARPHSASPASHRTSASPASHRRVPSGSSGAFDDTALTRTRDRRTAMDSRQPHSAQLPTGGASADKKGTWPRRRAPQAPSAGASRSVRRASREPSAERARARSVSRERRAGSQVSGPSPVKSHSSSRPGSASKTGTWPRNLRDRAASFLIDSHLNDMGRQHRHRDGHPGSARPAADRDGSEADASWLASLAASRGRSGSSNIAAHSSTNSINRSSQFNTSSTRDEEDQGRTRQPSDPASLSANSDELIAAAADANARLLRYGPDGDGGALPEAESWNMEEWEQQQAEYTASRLQQRERLVSRTADIPATRHGWLQQQHRQQRASRVAARAGDFDDDDDDDDDDLPPPHQQPRQVRQDAVPTSGRKTRHRTAGSLVSRDSDDERVLVAASNAALKARRHNSRSPVPAISPSRRRYSSSNTAAASRLSASQSYLSGTASSSCSLFVVIPLTSRFGIMCTHSHQRCSR